MIFSCFALAAVMKTVDFGPATVGGYTCFDVKSKTGEPVVKVEYANHPDGLTGKGDFTRESSARYLGSDVDLPVLPGNVNRHEIYRIGRTGRFVGPLIQGQARYARISVEPDDAQVEIENFTLTNVEVYATEPTVGEFRCSDERLNRLWEAGVQACRIASFPNHDAWKAVGGKLLPRKLRKGSSRGWCRTVSPADGTLEVVYEFDANPHFPVGYFVVLAGERSKSVEERSTNALKLVSLPIRKGERFGFEVRKESWPMIDSVAIRGADGKEVFREDFDGGLADWEYTRTLPFIADGAKRDRLVWSGDLWWAERSVFHAFSPDVPYLRDSLKMLAFNQTPEGFVHACPYPENSEPPESGDYGPWASDEFAAWLVPAAWDYLLYTGDAATLREIYPAIRRLMAYLKSNCRADGIFGQREETSKHALSERLGDCSHRLYMNVLLWKCYVDAAAIAAELGEEAESWRDDAQRLAAAIRANFWDAKKRHFNYSLEAQRFQAIANAFTMATGFLTAEEARVLAPKLVRLGVGKFQALIIRGKFGYGFGSGALDSIEGTNWLRMVDPSWPGAHCTTECMYLMTKGWWDESHPDTAISGQLSDYVLGLRPAEPGYRKWTFDPKPGKLTFAEGKVPTPRGVFEVGWKRKGGKLACRVREPGKDVREFELPVSVEPDVDAAAGVGSGQFEIVDFQTDPADDEYGHIEQVIDLGRIVAVPSVRFSPSQRFDGWPGNLTIEGAAEPDKFTRLKKLDRFERKNELVVDLGTVVGAPRVRYLRLSTTNPGGSWMGSCFNLQFAKIVIVIQEE